MSYHNYNEAKLVLGPLDAVSYSSDFSSDSDGWNFTRATLTAPDTHDGESNSMRMGLTAPAGQHFIYRTLFYGGYGRKATG